MGRLPRLRRFSGGRVRTGSLVALVVLFPAATLAMSGLNRDRQGEARAAAPSSAATSPNTAEGPQGIFKLDHLIFIVQENRSFDHYFGTYPGADGFEMDGGQPTNCVPDAVLGGESCVYHTSMDVFNGGPHSRPAALTDINGGAMNGFIDALPPTPRWCVDRAASEVRRIPRPGRPTGRDELPHPTGHPELLGLCATSTSCRTGCSRRPTAWTLPAHLFLVSGWSAYCYDPNDPMSCISDVDLKEEHERFEYGEDPIYAWTDITWLLDREGVSWGYYVAPGTCSFPPCHGQAIDGAEGSTTATRNPLPGFTDLHETGQQDHILDYGNFERAAARGTLPSVSWIVPGDGVSEHPQSSRGVAAGMAHVTRLVNAVMRGPDWDSSAIFITWDDWGGFYDHVNPPLADENGYGLRVPGLLVSPYARRGYIDHQTLTFDAYLKLIEDRFLGGQRLDPATDGRPDSRPLVRETLSILGDLALAFDFDRPPRPPMILDPTR